MDSHPLNSALRFVLELCMLGALAYWGYRRDDQTLRWVLMIAAPLAAAVLWGVFAVPGDPSRSGNTVIATAGWLRLVLELALFGSAAAALYQTGARSLAAVLIGFVVLHYAASCGRIAWLFGH